MSKFIFGKFKQRVWGRKILSIENHSKTKPIQLYAATKLSNEILALLLKNFNMKIIGLRFFHVWTLGRPDMALFKFMKKYFKTKQ